MNIKGDMIIPDVHLIAMLYFIGIDFQDEL